MAIRGRYRVVLDNRYSLAKELRIVVGCQLLVVSFQIDDLLRSIPSFPTYNQQLATNNYPNNYAPNPTAAD